MTTRVNRRRLTALAAGATAAGVLAVVAAGPGVGAPAPVAQATASALVLTIGGMPADSGTFAVKNDGTKQTSTGNRAPLLTAIPGQNLFNAGTLAQDAVTTVKNRVGSSAACSGIAGEGATVAAAGNGTTCLTPGQNLTLDAANLDLTGIELTDGTITMGLDQTVKDALNPVLNPVLTALQGALQSVLTSAGNPGVFLDIGAIQSACTANIDSAKADADLANVSAYVEFMGRHLDLLKLPVHPAPNTKVVTNLDVVVKALEAALKTQLSTALDGALGPAGGLIDQAAVLDNVLANISTQLAPLEDNLLEGTLNIQKKTSRNSIESTALELAVLPAARQFGVEALKVELGNTTCGPSGRVAVPASPSPTPTTPTPTPTHHTPGPVVPTSVPAGLASGAQDPGEGGSSPLGTAALAGVLLLAGGAGAASYRRSLRR